MGGPENNDTGAGAENPRRLYVYNGGFVTNRRVRRILSLAGLRPSVGLPQGGDLVGIWGNSPTAHRGRTVAARRDAALVTIEDAFLRSLFPGRDGEPPLGLLIDHKGAHFDPEQVSDLETLLATASLDDTALLNRARAAIERIKGAHLTKYFAVPDTAPLPDPGYVLVIDQTNGDAAVRASQATRATFREMLVFAQEEHPGCRVLIKTHPETVAGHRQGYFGPEDETDRVTLFADPISPWQLFEGATGVYTVSSQLGFEAIFAGHKPRVFGQPFYAGWGLTQDERPIPRRQRSLSRAQLFAATMILYPTWFDPYHNRLCELEQAIDAAEAMARAWRDDHQGWTAGGMRLWKRKPLSRFFGRYGTMRFAETPALDGERCMVWANRAKDWPETVVRVEDGFLRSKGLGAELVPPMSLVLDDLGIYYDPSRPSRLEQLIRDSGALRPDQLRRAEDLRRAILRHGLSKYNLGRDLPDLPSGHRILVPGQVEDDASILTGGGEVKSNLDLLRAVRAANPKAVILFKPHPDVEAGLRRGAVPVDDLADLADLVLPDTDPAPLLERVDEVWTMTSLMGFEALLRGKSVTTLGAPFYAGWGLTNDLGPVPPRRRTRATLDGLVHATLIGYPRYLDPVTSLPCPPEVIVERLSQGQVAHPGVANRALSKVQGMFASYAHLWR